MLNQPELTYNTPTQQLLPILKHPEEVRNGSVQLNHLEGVYSCSVRTELQLTRPKDYWLNLVHTVRVVQLH